MAQIDAFFKMMHELGASDLHLSAGSQPIIRLQGEMQRIKYKMLEHEELKKLLYEITPENKAKIFENNKEYVVVYKDDCTMEIRRITTIGQNEEHTFVKEKFAPNEKIVSSNALMIFEELNK